MSSTALPARPSRRRAPPSPAKDELQSPVTSHPLGQGEPPAAAPRSTAKSRPDKAKQADGRKSGGGAGRGAALAVLVVLLAVAGGGLYSRYGGPGGELLLAQLGSPRELLAQMKSPRELLARLGLSAWAPASGPPRKQQPRDPRDSLLPGGVELIPQPVPQLPPLPPITQQEIEAFEQATAEHYGVPESPHAQGEAHRLALEQQQAQAAAAKQAAAEEAVFVPGTGADAEAAAATFFDAAVHQQYLDLPAWPQATEAELTGGWNLTQAVYDYAAGLPMAKVLSWEEPRLAIFPSFLSPAEVGHMITISRDHLERSEVLVGEGKEKRSNVRTSFGFWPEPDDVTARIQERIHRTLGIPEPFGEGLYILNYQRGQKYDAHNDHVMDGSAYLRARRNIAEPVSVDFLKRAGGPACGPGKGGPSCGDRVATFIIYLASPNKGGTTAFPEAELTKQAMGAEHRPGTDPDEWYCRDDRVLAAAPPPGTGVLFWDYRPHDGSGTGSWEDGSADPLAMPVYAALHSGCPVEEGEKYVMTRWIRGARFY